MAKILLVDDDRDLCDVVTDSLNLEHFQVEACYDGNDALAAMKTNAHDLYILDWDLPGQSGTEICRRYRASGGLAPILILTGKTATADKVAGLGAGADDYLTKPFDMEELTARVKALLRRVAGTFGGDTLRSGEVVLEPGNFRVTRAGQEIRLIPKEFAILELLMRHPGKVFGPEAIINKVWDVNESPSNEVVRTHIKNLRRKLGGEGGEELIQTVHGVGYKVEPEDQKRVQ
ncbi:MAG TPA: response regulator transcription factor [Chroococcales cyanobacterium]